MNTQDALALDARIAIEFFGFIVNDASYEYDRFSTDWNDMACVVERLRTQGWLVKMQEMPDDIPWLASDVDEADLPIYKSAYVSLAYMKGRTSTDPKEARRYIHCHIYALAETLPEAVCRAALDTLTADKDEDKA